MKRPKCNNRPTIIPMVKLSPWQLTIYNHFEWPTKRRIEKSNHTTNTKDRATTYTGKLSTTSLRNLKMSIKLLIAQSEEKEALNYKTNSYFKFRCNFITLTLSATQGTHTDREIKSKLLDVWLKKAKRWFHLRSYVWRAERQVNSNIHFHLITDTYTDHALLRKSWNDTQQLLGYIDEFEKKNGHRNPNSTDVHAIRKIENLAAYICKYMTKTGKDENVIKGKVWGCSKNLMNKKGHSLMLDGEIRRETEYLLQKHDDRKFDAEFATILAFSESQWNEVIKGELKKEWHNYIREIRSGVKEEPTTPQK